VVVGVLTLTLVLPEAASLKDKRSVIKGLTARLRAKFNVAVAEVDTQDAPGVATLGVACLSNDAAHAHAVLERAVQFVERSRLDAMLADYSIEMW
jgi:uncharacterized protein YlxP (DUF503 family)